MRSILLLGLLMDERALAFAFVLPRCDKKELRDPVLLRRVDELQQQLGDLYEEQGLPRPRPKPKVMGVSRA